jgi:hypothetical protein
MREHDASSRRDAALPCATHRTLAGARLSEPLCGVHALRFVVPPDAPSYEPDVWVVHVDGEGMTDPTEPRLFPLNLLDKQGGPRLFNVRALGFPGRLRVAAGYLRRGGPWDAYEAHSAADADADDGGAGAAARAQLPVCDSGEAPGRWVVTHALYPAVPGEPLAWAPYGCRWPHVSGPRLAACVAQLGRVKFMGESTMGQLYETMLMHANTSSFMWPTRLPEHPQRLMAMTDRMRARGLHDEYHGLATMLDGEGKEDKGGGAAAELRAWKPHVVVHLQTANDAARDTFARFRERLAEYLRRVVALREEKPDVASTVLWITAPVRHYKAGNGPGSAACPEGTLASCRASDAGTAYMHVGDQVAWKSHVAAPPLFYGTLDRRRAFNAHAVATVRAALPHVRVVDFEAMTEALPSDICLDGEHWGCTFQGWQNRHREPFQCRSLAHLTLANVVANVMCGDLLDE